MTALLIPAALFAAEQPEIKTLEIPELKIPTLEVPGLAVPTLAVPELKVSALPEAEPLAVRSIQEDVDKHMELLRPFFRTVRDLRSFSSAKPDRAALAKWREIYENEVYRDYEIDFVPLSPGLRIINEIQSPPEDGDLSVLKARLALYKERGYNAVLVSFTTTENLEHLLSAIREAKAAGFKIVLTYSAGKEDLKEPVLRDPELLSDWLVTLGQQADALLLGWRRTSPHLLLQDAVFRNFLVLNARINHPNLPVIGMAYFGETAQGQHLVTYEIPEGCSAVLVVGLGYPRASTKSALKQLFPKLDAKKQHLIGLAVGETTYFDTEHNTGKTEQENFLIKRRIEIRLMQAGCLSTMTYSGDGSDGTRDLNKTENLCREYGADGK